jgi:hypothetical protein
VAISDLRRRILAGALLIAAVFTVIQAVDYRQDAPSNDTYQYAKQTLRFLGENSAQSVHDATVMYCQDAGNAAAAVAAVAAEAASATPAATAASAYDECLQIYRNGLTPSSPRYLAIFTSRPGYPLLAAPIAAVFGLRFGLWAATMLCTLLASLLVILLLRAAGCGVSVALLGQALYLAAPTGYWGSRTLTDGPSLTTALLTLVGAWWLVQHRTKAGLWLLGGGFVTGFVVRYSSEQMLALLIALAALAALKWVPTARHRDMRLLAAASGIGFVISEVASTLLGWPGVSDSLQDTFTKHFLQPDVSDPVTRLVRLDLHYWSSFPSSEPTALLTAVGLVALAVLLIRRHPVYGILVAAVALTGVGAVVAHPVASQSDRLMAPVWLLLVLGLPLLVAQRTTARPAGPEPTTEPSEPRSAPDSAARSADPEPTTDPSEPRPAMAADAARRT